MLGFGAAELVDGMCVHWTRRSRVQMGRLKQAETRTNIKSSRVFEEQSKSSVKHVVVLRARFRRSQDG
jgi:hypothetical protein